MPRTLPSPLLIAALCIALGSVIDATVKGLALSMAVPAIVAWRFLVGGSIALGVYRARPRPLPSLRAIRFHALRGAVQVTSALLFFWSLTQLALAEATVIGFTSALMIAPLGAVILKEPVTRTSAIAAATGFLGAIFAVSAATGGAPETGQRVAGAAAAFLAAFLYAVTLVLIRLRSREEDPLTIAMFSNVFPALFLSPLLVLSLPGLDVSALPVLVLLGILGFTVWWLFSIAYSRAPAQKLAPIEYTALIWSGLLGAAFFGEVPGWRLYAGAVIIIAACLIVAVEDRFETRRAARLPASDMPD